MEVVQMDLKYLLLLVLLIGVIFLSVKWIEKFLKKKKSNEKKRKEIDTKIDDAFETYSDRLEQVSKDYEDLHSDFIEYKRASEKAIEEMQKYSNKAINICNEIIDFDKAFDEKLKLWSELLNDPKNNQKVQKSIEEHIRYDIKLHKDIVHQQNEERISCNERVRQHLGLK